MWHSVAQCGTVWHELCTRQPWFSAFAIGLQVWAPATTVGLTAVTPCVVPCGLKHSPGNPVLRFSSCFGSGSRPRFLCAQMAAQGVNRPADAPRGQGSGCRGP